MDKENVACACSGIVFRFQKERNLGICNNMDQI
jgi:hypothetical protein